MSRRPFVIGLTGNIATGKSLVGGMLSELGAEHIDADRLAHQVMAPGTVAWQQIVDTFGGEILAPDGSVDRPQLGRVVFADPSALARLEEIVHPAVIRLTRERIAASTTPVVVIEAIKLIESGMVRQLCDALWVVTAPQEVQIQRLVETRKLSREQAILRIDAQPQQQYKIAQADVLIDNSGTLDATREQVARAWREIGSLWGPARPDGDERSNSWTSRSIELP